MALLHSPERSPQIEQGLRSWIDADPLHAAASSHYTLEVMTVRGATDEEMKAGGAIGALPTVDASLMRPV